MTRSLDGQCYFMLWLRDMRIPRSCSAYYYGGLRLKGQRRKCRLWVTDGVLHFYAPEGKKVPKIDLEVPFSRMEKIFLTRDNYYGSDTVHFNLTFRDQAENSFTLKFAPITLFPRRRITLQGEWFNYLDKVINSSGSASPLSTK